MFNLFNKEFVVVEYCENNFGEKYTCTRYYHGSKNRIKKIIEYFKAESSEWHLFENGMSVVRA